MKKYIHILSAIIICTVTFSACADNSSGTASESTVPESVTAEVSATETSAAPMADFDLMKLVEGSKTSVLLEKYGSFSVNYSMDYGEIINQQAGFSLNADNTITYVNNTDGNIEYFDGRTDYLLEYDENGGTEGYAYASLPGASAGMDLENYIFTYSEDDEMVVTGYTQNDDGSYIISAAESYTDSYDDTNGNTVSIAYKYEYTITATKDFEVTRLSCVCTNANTGEVDSNLDMKVDYNAAPPEIPEFMNETFEITVITISGESEVTSAYEIPVSFSPFFTAPPDGEYFFFFDREQTVPVDDTMTIDYPCTLYAVKAAV